MKVRSYLLTSVAFLSIFHAHSQEVKKIVTDFGENMPAHREVYHVLKDSPSIKHGSYEYEVNDLPVIKGTYYHGQKDGVWKYFGSKGVCFQSVYNKGVKTGIWQCRNAQGKLIYAYDFSKGEGVAYIKDEHPDTVKCFVQNANGQWDKDQSVKLPVTLFTPSTWLRFLANNLRYPEDAVDRNATGRVLVTLTCDESGHAMNYEVASNSDSVLNAEVLRVMRLFDFEFLPAEKEGKKVKFQVDQPVEFKLFAEIKLKQ
jgi:TonB family protein